MSTVCIYLVRPTRGVFPAGYGHDIRLLCLRVDAGIYQIFRARVELVGDGRSVNRWLRAHL